MYLLTFLSSIPVARVCLPPVWLSNLRTLLWSSSYLILHNVGPDSTHYNCNFYSLHMQMYSLHSHLRDGAPSLQPLPRPPTLIPDSRRPYYISYGLATEEPLLSVHMIAPKISDNVEVIFVNEESSDGSMRHLNWQMTSST